MEHIQSENLKKLAIAYNRRNMYALVFCRFELKQGEIRTYPTAKNALVFPIEGKATFQLDQTSYYMKRGNFCMLAQENCLQSVIKITDPFDIL